MSHFLITVGAMIAVIAVAAPIVAIFMVSVASRREESGHTLSGHAPGPITSAARRLLAYRAQTADRPAWVQSQDQRRRPRPAVAPNRGLHASRAHARPAIEPLTIRLAPETTQDRREPAGTRAA